MAAQQGQANDVNFLRNLMTQQNMNGQQSVGLPMEQSESNDLRKRSAGSPPADPSSQVPTTVSGAPYSHVSTQRQLYSLQNQAMAQLLQAQQKMIQKSVDKVCLFRDAFVYLLIIIGKES